MVSCKSTVIKPTDFSFLGFQLHQNSTFEFYYSEHDVAGHIMNVGDYKYRGDTLILNTGHDAYIERIAKPEVFQCEEQMLIIDLQFLTKDKPYFGSVNDKPQTTMAVMSKSIDQDTTQLGAWNRSNPLRSTKLKFPVSTLSNIESIWLEIESNVIVKPIELPETDHCLNISMPVIWPNLFIWEEPITYGMTKFIIRKRNERVYFIEAIERDETYKIKAASAKK